MSHNVCGLVIVEPYDLWVARHYDLYEQLAHGSLVMFPIDHYWSAYWQAKRGATGVLPGEQLPAIFPRESVVRTIAYELVGRAAKFAVILTEYFGGPGGQWAIAFDGDRQLSNGNVNAALRALGIVAAPGLDEWDTIGLADWRRNPRYLDRYEQLCDELGV